MSTDLTKFFAGHQMPSREKLTEALAGFSAGKAALMGKALLRLTKQGKWVFGADSEPFDDNVELIASPASLSSGYIAWYQGKPEGEQMQPLSMGPVDASKLGPVNSGSIPPGQKKPSGRGWETQVSVELITRGDTPLQLIYKTPSLGGMRQLLTFAGEVAFAMSENPKRAYPIVKLNTDSYIHKEYGEVFTPVLEIIGWLDEQGAPVVDRPKLV